MLHVCPTHSNSYSGLSRGATWVEPGQPVNPLGFYPGPYFNQSAGSTHPEAATNSQVHHSLGRVQVSCASLRLSPNALILVMTNYRHVVRESSPVLSMYFVPRILAYPRREQARRQRQRRRRLDHGGGQLGRRRRSCAARSGSRKH